MRLICSRHQLEEIEHAQARPMHDRLPCAIHVVYCAHTKFPEPEADIEGRTGCGFKQRQRSPRKATLMTFVTHAAYFAYFANNDSIAGSFMFCGVTVTTPTNRVRGGG